MAITLAAFGAILILQNLVILALAHAAYRQAKITRELEARG